MKKLLTALFALVAGASVALAADLPSKTAPTAPAVSTSVFALNGYYLGGSFGGNFDRFKDVKLDTTPYNIGAVAGYEWNRWLRTEVTYDYTSEKRPTTTRTGQAGFANAIGQYSISGIGVTPYLLAGVGYGNGAWGKGVHGDAQTLYNVGGGVRYAITSHFELDGRYRYVNSMEGKKLDNVSIISAGFNYKF